MNAKQILHYCTEHLTDTVLVASWGEKGISNLIKRHEWRQNDKTKINNRWYSSDYLIGYPTLHSNLVVI